MITRSGIEELVRLSKAMPAGKLDLFAEMVNRELHDRQGGAWLTPNDIWKIYEPLRYGSPTLEGN